jgi:hypothetical protein
MCNIPEDTILLWGTAYTPKKETLESVIMEATWFVPSTVIRKDFQTPAVKD